MTTKHRIIEIITIITVTVFVVFLVRSCSEPTQADSPNDIRLKEICAEMDAEYTSMAIKFYSSGYDCDGPNCDKEHIHLMSNSGGIVITNSPEPNDKEVADKFILISDSNINEISFSCEEGIIVCDSTQEEFLETLPLYIHYQLTTKDPNGPIEIEWAEPNEAIVITKVEVNMWDCDYCTEKFGSWEAQQRHMLYFCSVLHPPTDTEKNLEAIESRLKALEENLNNFVNVMLKYVNKIHFTEPNEPNEIEYTLNSGGDTVNFSPRYYDKTSLFGIETDVYNLKYQFESLKSRVKALEERPYMYLNQKMDYVDVNDVEFWDGNFFRCDFEGKQE